MAAAGRAAPRGPELGTARWADGAVPTGAAGDRPATLPGGRLDLAAAAGQRRGNTDRAVGCRGWLEPQAPDHQVPPAGRAPAQDRGPADPLRPGVAAPGPVRGASRVGGPGPRGWLCRPGTPDPRVPPVHRDDSNPVPGPDAPPDSNGGQEVNSIQDAVAATSYPGRSRSSVQARRSDARTVGAVLGRSRGAGTDPAGGGDAGLRVSSSRPSSSM
jgi:hypothetical protein